MPQTLDLYRRLTDKPLGRTAFSVAFALKAPYFASIRPRVLVMEPHRGEVLIRKRRAVQNHIGTIHAIAVANGLEAAMGLLCEATVPDGMRWLPKGIALDYHAKVPTDVRCIATTEPADWDKEPPFQVDVRVAALLGDGADGDGADGGGAEGDGTEVVAGVIPVWVTARS